MDEVKNVKLKALRSFSGSQTSASYLGRIEGDEEFEALPDDASYLVRNGFATRVEAPADSSDSPTSDEVEKPAPIAASNSEETFSETSTANASEETRPGDTT